LGVIVFLMSVVIFLVDCDDLKVILWVMFWMLILIFMGGGFLVLVMVGVEGSVGVFRVG